MISRSQSRITSSTLSTWKNTHSNFNMVTLDQHGDHSSSSTWTSIMEPLLQNTTIRLSKLLKSTRSDKLITNNICPAISPCRLQTRRPTTSPSPSIRPPLQTWFTLPSVNRPFYENDSFILDRNCETRTLKETLKKKIRANFVYLTNSKSDWQMFQVKKVHII